MITDDIKVYLEDDLLIVDFGVKLISEETMLYVTQKHEKLTGIVKSKILIFGQGALDLTGKVKEFSASKRVTDITAAVALVPTTKVGYIAANIFLTITTAPYPTKVFKTAEEAKYWLNSLEV